MARFKIDIDQGLWARTRVRALETGVTASAVVEQALKGLLDQTAPVVRATTVKAVEPPAAEVRPKVAPTPLEDLPEALAEDDLGLSFGASRPAPKPTSSKPAAARPVRR